MTARLSPAMRNMLRAAIAGKSVANGDTRDALIKRGMLDDASQPTEAGRAIFTPIFTPGPASVYGEHRPGANAVFERLKREHPNWSDLKTAKQAKKLRCDEGVTC